MNPKGIVKIVCVMGLGVMLGACRGQLSEKPPVHPNLNMDQQPRKEAQEVNAFFDDNRSMRTPVEGTIARGYRKADLAYYEGVDANGRWIAENPVEITKSFLYRGKERYEIYCTPCHGGVGDGQGIIMTGRYGYVPAPTYHSDRLREAPDGELYSAIYNGVRSMPSYATQIPVDDRWAIVAYIRALQASQNATESELRAFDVDVAALQNDYTAELERQAALEEARTANTEVQASVDLGRQLVMQNGCSACHSTEAVDGIGPGWGGLFGSEAEVLTDSGDRTTITKDEAYIRESIVNPGAKKTSGYENGIMVAYDYLADHEIESLVLYIKSLSDN